MGQTSNLRSEVQTLRIFVGSPDDVLEERRIVRKLISKLAKHPAHRGKINLELVECGDPAAPITMQATQTPQRSVSAALPLPADCDVVIIIFWAKMGTPLPPDQYRKKSGEVYFSGTEFEYENARDSRRTPPPTILIYRSAADPMVSLRDPDLYSKIRQLKRLDRFFDKFHNRDGSENGSYQKYNDITTFESLLEHNLNDICSRKIYLPQQKATTTTTEGYFNQMRNRLDVVDISSLGATSRHTLCLKDVYVPSSTRSSHSKLSGTSEKQEAHPHGSYLLQLLDQRSLYISGPAGAGKTTFCRWAALRSIEVADDPDDVSESCAEPVPLNLHGRLPLFIDLRDLSTNIDFKAGKTVLYPQDLEAAIARWAEPVGLSTETVEVALEEGRTLLLLDAIDLVPDSLEVNEGHVSPRTLLLRGLADALPGWQKVGNRVAITGRPGSVDEADLNRLDLHRAPLEPLSKVTQEEFLCRFFKKVGQARPPQDLLETVRSGYGDVQILLENPLYLTAVCILYDDGMQLPQSRFELYSRIVNKVLGQRYNGESLDRFLAMLENIAFRLHIGSPESPRTVPAVEASCVEIEAAIAAFLGVDTDTEYGRTKAVRHRKEIVERSGFFVPRTGDRFAFHHLSFQDFFSALKMLRKPGRYLDDFLQRAAVTEWRQTLTFLFSARIIHEGEQWGMSLIDKLIEDQAYLHGNSSPSTAVFVAEALELYLAKGHSVSENVKRGFQRLSEEAIEKEVELYSRQTLAQCLGRLGDPRITSLREPSAYIEVPPADYPYGNKGKKFNVNKPFWISRYPVTNSQYSEFMRDEGYDDPNREWWSSEGLSWRRARRVAGPAYFSDRRWNGNNKPVVGVSYWEAEAFCNWVGGRLPSEKEWEAAARGPEGLRYPWGSNWENGICNTAELGLSGTSPVGLFPRARQVRLGIEDLSGNVREWCATIHERDPEEIDSARLQESIDRTYHSRLRPSVPRIVMNIALESTRNQMVINGLNSSPHFYRDKQVNSKINAPRVLRGGSWYYDKDSARLTSRMRSDPRMRYNSVGFRVVIQD